MRRYTQLAYLFHQCATSLLSRDSCIADCTVRHPGVELPFSSFLTLFPTKASMYFRPNTVYMLHTLMLIFLLPFKGINISYCVYFIIQNIFNGKTDESRILVTRNSFGHTDRFNIYSS